MLTPQHLVIGLITVVIVLDLCSQFTKGRAKQTADGVEFRLKPLVRISIVFVPSYLLWTWWVLHSQGYPLPWWFTVPIAVITIASTLIRSPGMIRLTPTAAMQRSWLLPSKQIAYEDVMTIRSEMTRNGSATLVRGSTRVNIVHWHGRHSAADEFRAEMEKRTGKRVVS